MDDPFGPLIAGLISLLLAAVVRIASSSMPFIDEAELRRQAEGDSPRARRAVRLIERADIRFGELQMAWLCLNLIAFAAIGGYLTPRLTDVFVNGYAVAQGKALVWGTVLILLAFALVSCVFTGVIPGYLAAHGRQKLFDRIAPLAEWTAIAFSPLSKLALLLGRLILKPFRLAEVDSRELVTEEDIREMVDIGEEKGAIESDEKEMIENILEFNNMNAGDCMIHRKDITAIEIDSTEEDILEAIQESGRSRFPVYEDNIDNVLGILTTRDFLMDRCAGSKTPLKELIRPAHFVPESVRTDVLFKEMQARKQHIAIVVDEYGGTSGLITLEDLLEEIVGNIYDEYDPKEDEDIQPLTEGRWRISGSADLENIAAALEIELPTDEEFDTLGGLVFSQLTEIPADGERPVVECFGLRISVEEIADRRVEWAIVEKLKAEEPEEEA